MQYDLCSVKSESDYLELTLFQPPTTMVKEKILFIHDENFVTCFRHIQNECCFYYDTMYLTSLHDYLSKHPIGKQELTQLFLDLMNTMCKQHYVLFHLDHIYYDSSKKLHFCIVPGAKSIPQNITITFQELFELIDFKGDEAWLSRLYFLAKRQPFNPDLLRQFLIKKDPKHHWFSFFKRNKEESFDFFDTYALHEPKASYDTSTSVLNDDLATQLLFTDVNLRYLEDAVGHQTLIHINPFIVGRGEGCNFVIAFPEVSKSHCRFELIEMVCFIVDMGSTNGTYLNHDRLTPNQTYPLKDGDVIQIGNQTFIYHQS